MPTPGPLPSKKKVRRNEPTIPTTELPVSGRTAPAPPLPRGHQLGKRGTAFWRWAWKTPQAAAWDDGAVPFVMRRCELEDDRAALETFDIGEIPVDPISQEIWLESIERLVRLVKSMAGGSLRVIKEMDQLDDRLGLNPRALAQLRWTIVEDPPVSEPSPAAEGDAKPVTNLSDRRKRLTGA